MQYSLVVLEIVSSSVPPFDMDRLAKIHSCHWAEQADMKRNEETALQSDECMRGCNICLLNFATLQSYISWCFWHITLKFGSFTNFRSLHPVVAMEFR